ncbi:MAG: hypothetical protein PGN09_01550 [Sphingomonas fennica]
MVDEGETHLTRTEARAGSTNRVTRYVLAISLALIVVVFAGLLLVWR